jgi:hypothetical protein
MGRLAANDVRYEQTGKAGAWAVRAPNHTNELRCRISEFRQE